MPLLDLDKILKWLMLDEQEIGRSPMERVRQSKTRRKLIPVIRRRHVEGAWHLSPDPPVHFVVSGGDVDTGAS